MLILRSSGLSACRDCAQTGFGGPAENRFTAYDALCRGAACRDAGFPQVFVNAANLTLFVRVTDLAFGGPAPALVLEQSFNGDDTRSGVLGTGWSFSLGDSITTDPDGSLVLRRGSGRTDRFTSAVGSTALFPVTNTTDSLTRAADGTYTLRAAASATSRTFSSRWKTAFHTGWLRRAGVAGLRFFRTPQCRSLSRQADQLRHRRQRPHHVHQGCRRPSVSFSYSDDGRLTQQTNADGQTTAYQYDAAGNLTSIAWAGGKTAIAYARRRRLSRAWRP